MTKVVTPSLFSRPPPLCSSLSCDSQILLKALYQPCIPPLTVYRRPLSLYTMATPSTNKFRTYVLTGSVAAITATGAWYGAGMKTRREYTKVRDSEMV